MAMERRKAGLPMEEFVTSELGVAAIGAVGGGVLHMITESLLDSFLESKYPDKYPIYSTGIAAGIWTTVGVALFIYGRKGGPVYLQYIGGGMVLAELIQWLDMVKVSFEIAR